MKTIFSLLVIMLLAAGCNKQKTIQRDLTGTWQAYKYLLHNADETQQFTNRYGTYTIKFDGSSRFALFVTGPYPAVSGTYFFADNNEQLVLVDTTYTLVNSINVAVANQQQYNIFDLTSANLQLLTDSSDLYLEKIK